MKYNYITTIILALMIAIGSIIGLSNSAPQSLGNVTDYLILILVSLVIFDTPIANLKKVHKSPHIMGIALALNFIVIPLIGFTLTQVFLPQQPLIGLGLAIYFMSPCTDWFLGFTRMAGGNTALGSVLLPVNMIIQIILFPLWIQLFSNYSVAALDMSEITSTIYNWFIIPVLIAFALKGLCMAISSLQPIVSSLTNICLYILVLVIFATNVQEIASHVSIFITVLGVTMVFFAVTFNITERVVTICKVNVSDHILITMTTSARNAPFMLALTMAAIPDQPLIYASLVIGMLIEFPYLAFLVWRSNKVQQRQDHSYSQTKTSEA